MPEPDSVSRQDPGGNGWLVRGCEAALRSTGRGVGARLVHRRIPLHLLRPPGNVRSLPGSGGPAGLGLAPPPKTARVRWDKFASASGSGVGPSPCPPRPYSRSVETFAGGFVGGDSGWRIPTNNRAQSIGSSPDRTYSRARQMTTRASAGEAAGPPPRAPGAAHHHAHRRGRGGRIVRGVWRLRSDIPHGSRL